MNLAKSSSLSLDDRDDQERIFAEVKQRTPAAAQVEAAFKAGLKRAERLRQAILKQAFEGRLVETYNISPTDGVHLPKVMRKN